MEEFKNQYYSSASRKLSRLYIYTLEHVAHSMRAQYHTQYFLIIKLFLKIFLGNIIVFDQVVKFHSVKVEVTDPDSVKIIVYLSEVRKGNVVISCKYQKCSSHLIT